MASISFKPTISFPSFPFHTSKPRNPKFSVSASSSTMAATSTSSTLYQVLGIPATASGYEIKRAYRNLARTCHPDVVAVNQKDSMAAQFIKIHDAYATLSDPDKRARYDRDLVMRSIGGRRGVGMSESVGPGSRFKGYANGRNWETDQCW